MHPEPSASAPPESTPQPSGINAAQMERPPPEGRVITWRSGFFGLLGICLMSGLAAYHDDILGGTLMIGNHIPGGAFTYIIALGLFWNGAWALAARLLRAERPRRMMLNSQELAVVFALTLVACFPPTSGLFRYFHRAVMLPWYYLQSKAAWLSHGLLSNPQYMRPALFPAPWPGVMAAGGAEPAGYDLVYRGFFTGLAVGAEPLSLAELWRAGIFRAWLGPLMTWGPFVLLMSMAVVSLQYLAHRQWSRHEQLGYPVAQVAAGFCAIRRGGRGVPDIFKNRLFWWGFLPVSAVLLIIVTSAWWPQNVPALREMAPHFKNWWLPFERPFPLVKHVPGYWALNSQSLYFTIVGLAYFVSSEISLTMGVTMFAQAIFGVSFYLATGGPVQESWMGTSRAGAYVGYTMILLWTGRSYYRAVFAKAFSLRRPQDEDEALSVAAARTLALSAAAFALVLSWLCQSWLVAVFYTLLALVMFFGVSRVVCETGVPFIHTHWDAGRLLVSLLGPAAVGPKALAFTLHSSAVMAYDPRECLMPYVATGAKVAEENGVRLRRLYRVVLAAVALAIAIAFVSTTYTYYNYNCWPVSDQHAVNYPPVVFLDQAARGFVEMKASGVFERSLGASALGRLRFAEAADAWTPRFFFAGLAGVLALSSIRFRFSKFPIHPVIFLVAGAYSCTVMWGSFLIGWFVKTLVVRFGGGGVYQRLKPMFIGMIAAELFMVGSLVALDFAYYLINGTRAPVTVSIMPW